MFTPRRLIINAEFKGVHLVYTVGAAYCNYFGNKIIQKLALAHTGWKTHAVDTDNAEYYELLEEGGLETERLVSE